MPRVPESADEVTSAWLCAAMNVRGVEIDELERLTMNNPVVSQLFRAHISFNGEPATVIVKIPSLRKEHRRMIAGERIYERESATYDLLEMWQGTFVPRVLANVRDEEAGTTALVLEDLGAPFAGEEAGQVSVDSAEIVLERLAGVHAAFWGGEALRGYGWVRPAETSDLFSEPVEKFGPAWRNMIASGRITVGRNALKLGERLIDELGGVMERLHRRPQTLVHADLHQANLVFRHGDPSDPVVIDWGNTASCGATSDLAKFLATSLNVADLAIHEHSLLRTYHVALLEASSNPYPQRGNRLRQTRPGTGMRANPSFRRMPESSGSNPLSLVGEGQGEGEAGQSERQAITYTLDQLTIDYRLAQLATLANYVIANYTPGSGPDVPETSSPSLRAVLGAVDATGDLP